MPTRLLLATIFRVIVVHVGFVLWLSWQIYNKEMKVPTIFLKISNGDFLF